MTWGRVNYQQKFFFKKVNYSFKNYNRESEHYKKVTIMKVFKDGKINNHSAYEGT